LTGIISPWEVPRALTYCVDALEFTKRRETVKDEKDTGKSQDEKLRITVMKTSSSLMKIKG
jgi:hypothetical protein